MEDIKTGSAVIDPAVKTIEQKRQEQGMQPRQAPRAVEWGEMKTLAKEKGIPTTGKGVNRIYLSKALSEYGVHVQ